MNVFKQLLPAKHDIGGAFKYGAGEFLLLVVAGILRE